MKKIAILTTLFVVCSFGVSFAAYTADEVTGSAGFLVQLSNKVQMDYNPESTGLGYSVAAYHTSGTKTFASSSGDSKIFWILEADGTTGAPTAPTGTSSADFSAWEPL